jgi:hypothetical protein
LRFPRPLLVVAWFAVLSGAGGMALPRPALAQGPPGGPDDEGEISLERAVAAVADLLFALADGTSEKVFDFLETVELFDFENEIDRLVGDPRALNDSTAYKLSLLPYHIRFPIYQQLVRQMTRQDDLRSRRIHNVTPDAVNVIALRIGALADQDVTDEVRASMLKHFNAREVVDLGFFLLAQQRFFPETEEGWQNLKRRIADGGPAAAAAALAAGAAFDVGALSRSGTVARLLDRQLRVGWYAGFRRMGFKLRPYLRAGLSFELPELQFAVGLAQQVRPLPTEPFRALELAVREGWLYRMVRASGWDAFMEGAVRYVLQEPEVFLGERSTARAGFFAKREQLPGRWKTFGLRFSAEAESDFGQHVRFATGLGLQHLHTGITSVLQASRTVDPARGDESADTQGGIFLAGTMESPTHAFVASMRSQARLVLDEWEVLHAIEQRLQENEQRLRSLGTSALSLDSARAALAGMDRAFRERESHLGDVGVRLASYLESRRLAYSIKRWEPQQGGLHGPLDPQVLTTVREQVFTRLKDLSVGLQRAADRLQQLRDRQAVVGERMRTLEKVNPQSTAVAGYAEELAVLELRLRRESATADRQLQAYLECRDSARRIKAAAPAGLARLDTDPADAEVIRRVMLLRSLPLDPAPPPPPVGGGLATAGGR